MIWFLVVVTLHLDGSITRDVIGEFRSGPECQAAQFRVIGDFPGDRFECRFGSRT